ncbi:hypothetical protein AGMMS49936_03590 [Endomicrobiia bacterium]|nr:hypothetical protein AGMMS49936_03590 [Endomicrobiia bacterium]
MKLTYHQSKSNRSLKAISAIVLFGFLCLSSCDKKNAFLVNRRIATPERVEEIKEREKAKEAKREKQNEKKNKKKQKQNKKKTQKQKEVNHHLHQVTR